jgi:hypothetical protein
MKRANKAGIQRMNNVLAHMRAFISLHVNDDPPIEHSDFGTYQGVRIHPKGEPSFFLTEDRHTYVVKAKSVDGSVFISKKVKLDTSLIGVVSYLHAIGKVSNLLAGGMTLAKMHFPNGQHSGFLHVHWDNDHGTITRRWIVFNKTFNAVFYGFEENGQPMFAAYVTFFGPRDKDQVPKTISTHGSEFDTQLNWGSHKSVKKLYYGPDPFAAIEAIKSSDGVLY